MNINQLAKKLLEFEGYDFSIDDDSEELILKLSQSDDDKFLRECKTPGGIKFIWFVEKLPTFEGQDQNSSSIILENGNLYHVSDLNVSDIFNLEEIGKVIDKLFS